MTAKPSSSKRDELVPSSEQLVLLELLAAQPPQQQRAREARAVGEVHEGKYERAEEVRGIAAPGGEPGGVQRGERGVGREREPGGAAARRDGACASLTPGFR